MNRRLATPAISLLGIAGIVLLFAAASSASVVGNLEVGSGNGTFTLTLSSMAFNPDTAANPPGPPWNGEIANTTSLTFAGCAGGVLGTAGCLDSGVPAEGVEFANNSPMVLGGGLGPNNPFIQFAGNGVTHATILYTVASVGPGSSNTNCSGLIIGNSCSIFLGDPLVLTLTVSGTTLSWGSAGTVTDGFGTSNWIGGLTEPITGMTPGQIQHFFCPGATCTPADFASTNSITKPWAGDFLATATAQTPEPGSLPLFGSGMIVLAGVLRRKLRA